MTSHTVHLRSTAESHVTSSIAHVFAFIRSQSRGWTHVSGVSGTGCTTKVQACRAPRVGKGKCARGASTWSDRLENSLPVRGIVIFRLFRGIGGQEKKFTMLLAKVESGMFN